MTQKNLSNIYNHNFIAQLDKCLKFLLFKQMFNIVQKKKNIL